MSVKLDIKYIDQASPRLRRQVAALRDRRAMHAEIAMGVERLVLRSLQAKQAIPNKLGGKRTDYWARIRDGVRVEADGSSAAVVVPGRGVALHYYGGTVRPTKRAALTIPISAMAHGMTVADFADRQVFKFRSKAGNDILAIRIGTGKDARIEPLFVLRKSATIPADPTVLPETAAIADTAVKYAAAYIERIGEEVA